MLYLRKTKPSDIDILFEWANDEEVRKNAFSTAAICYEEHIAWFNEMMEHPNKVQYILMSDDNPIGQVRLSINKNSAEIGYSISKHNRGCGYGRSIIQLVKQQVLVEYPEVTKLIGRVKPSNAASLQCFIKNGFQEEYRQLEYDLSLTSLENTEFSKKLGGGVLDKENKPVS